MYKYSIKIIIVLFIFAILLEINAYDYQESSKSNYNINTISMNNTLDNKLEYFSKNYNVNIKVFETPNVSDYEVTTSNKEEIISTLDEIEIFLRSFNKGFFENFYKYGMNGVNIYLASDIYRLSDGFNNTIVTGFYYKSDSYNVVIKTNTDIKRVIAHEFMHMIDDYLNTLGANISYWEVLNSDDFSYEHIYYVNEIYPDTLGNNNYKEDIYFVDNYSRSSALEDKARIFELTFTDFDFSKYPHLNDKKNYLIYELKRFFPNLNI